MKRTLSILGSSGSIGRQTLKVAEACGHRVAAITVNRSVELAEAQVRKFRPGLVVAVDEAAAAELQVRLADTDAKVLSGQEGLLEAASLPEADTVVTAIVGVAGLRPTLAAINCGKRIALANKETLVCAGELVMARARKLSRWTRSTPQSFNACKGVKTGVRSGASSSLLPAGRFTGKTVKSFPLSQKSRR